MDIPVQLAHSNGLLTEATRQVATRPRWWSTSHPRSWGCWGFLCLGLFAAALSVDGQTLGGIGRRIKGLIDYGVGRLKADRC